MIAIIIQNRNENTEPITPSTEGTNIATSTSTMIKSIKRFVVPICFYIWEKSNKRLLV
jgi:hypothetical protein